MISWGEEREMAVGFLLHLRMRLDLREWREKRSFVSLPCFLTGVACWLEGSACYSWGWDKVTKWE